MGKRGMSELHLVLVKERLSCPEKQKGLKTTFTTSNSLNLYVEDIETKRECQFSKFMETEDDQLNQDQKNLKTLRRSFFQFHTSEGERRFCGKKNREVLLLLAQK